MSETYGEDWPNPSDVRDFCTCGQVWRDQPNPHALTCALHVRDDSEHAPWTPQRRNPFARLHGFRVLVRDWLWLRRVRRNTSNPPEGLWDKRNTPSGAFEAVKRSGDVFKGVKREN